ncbi:MAG: hypothetical protein ACREBU_19075, partial [Nitrososphaera sp.]
VRNAAGVTVSLGTTSSAVEPQARTNLEMSWVPQQPGTYEARAFLVSSLQDPVNISQVMVTEITVGGTSSDL